MNRFYALITISISLLSAGCASTNDNVSPNFGAGALNGDRRLCLVRAPSPTTYVLGQTTIANPGLAKDVIDNGNKSNSEIFTERAKALQPGVNLYDVYFDQVVANFLGRGYTVEQVIAADGSPAALTAGTQNCRSNWIILVRFSLIHYYAKTLLSSYRPKTSVMFAPYNKNTGIYYRPVFVNAELAEDDVSYATARGVLDDFPRSLANLEKTVHMAADLSVVKLLGENAK